MNCIEWWGAVGNHGYGVTYRGGQELAHRRIYTETLGPIPEDRIIHHTCANRRCVNPAHMVLTTRAEHPSVYDAKQTPKTHCKHGHEIAVVGRIAGGGCRECHRVHYRRVNERRRVRA